ncbi:MAG: CAP domain-containing protein [Flavobacteriales bacterium]
MKLLTKLPLLALLAALTFSCSTDSIDDKAEYLTSNLVVPTPTPLELEILELINDHRLSVGLNPLQNMDLIKSQAFNHADYMAENQKISHDYFFERSAFLKQKAGAIKVAENVAYGFTTAQSLVNEWIKSEAHKANIEGDFTNFDISAEKGTDNKLYYTNIFIKR